MSDRAVAIYALCEPGTMEIRYIGKSCEVRQRFLAHLSAARKSRKTHCYRWIGAVLDKGLEPEVIVLEYLRPGADWGTMERWWIAWGRSQGWRLTNATDGGDGAHGWKPTKEWREQRRAIALAMSDDHKRRLRESNIGNKHSLGKKRSEEARLRTSESAKGNSRARDHHAPRLREIAPRVVEMYQAGYPMREAAKALGTCQDIVRRILNEHGVPIRHHNSGRKRRPRMSVSA